MSERRTERIHIRVHPATKKRWEHWVERGSYGNLTDLIVEAVEEAHSSTAGATGCDDGLPDNHGGRAEQFRDLVPASDAPTEVGDGSGSATTDERVGDSVDEPENEVTPGETPRISEDATPAHPDGGESVAPTPPAGAVFKSDTCPAKKVHRSGWKCRYCHEMIP